MVEGRVTKYKHVLSGRTLTSESSVVLKPQGQGDVKPSAYKHLTLFLGMTKTKERALHQCHVPSEVARRPVHQPRESVLLVASGSSIQMNSSLSLVLYAVIVGLGLSGCQFKAGTISGKDDVMTYKARVQQTFHTIFEQAGIRRVECKDSKPEEFHVACGAFTASNIQTARREFTRKFDPIAKKYMTPKGPWVESIGVNRTYATVIRGRPATVYVGFRNNIVSDPSSPSGMAEGGLVGMSILRDDE